ncbi:hypothetical protein [Ruegeria sp. HKCCC1038]|uniref:hypothetical protein n=1 Tax=Ruegeria sp. HKCCC1038 TaxID=2682982 RepID=UPI001487DEB3|nr:hypothetical protein [Ruegeria sp. HKCCC1038]
MAKSIHAFSFNFALISTLLVLATLKTASADTWANAFPNIPSCLNSYTVPKITSAGVVATRPEGELYCLVGDQLALGSKIKLFEDLQSLVEPSHRLKHLHISAHYLLEADTPKFLCRLASEDTTITVYGQNSFVSPLHLSPDWSDQLLQCFSSVNLKLIGCDPFSDEGLKIDAPCTRRNQNDGGSAELPNAHHVKLIILEYIDDENEEKSSVSAFGSGNFVQSSLTTNVEDWLLIKDIIPASQDFWWTCIIEYLSGLALLSMDEVGANYRSCQDSWGETISVNEGTGGFSYLLMPEDSDRYFEIWSEMVSSAEKVVIVAQFFESKRIKKIIEDNPDTQVTILVDDAYFVSAETETSANFIKPERAKEMLEFVAANSHVSVRYLQTNHDYELNEMTNTIHARSALFESGSEFSSMVGSAHFRDGAIFKNSEQQFFLSGSAAESHREFFSDLLGRSVSFDKIGIESFQE